MTDKFRAVIAAHVKAFIKEQAIEAIRQDEQVAPQVAKEPVETPSYTLNRGVGKNGMEFINLYNGKNQVAYAYKVQRNNSWDVKVKDQDTMDKLGFEKAQFAGMASEALFFYSKYHTIKKQYAKAKREGTEDITKMADLYERAVKYAKEKSIKIEA